MRPLRAQINLGALTHNLDVLRQHAPNSKSVAVLKANAYGHGLTQVAAALYAADAFAVLSLDEAVQLRESGITRPIILLEGFFSSCELPVISQHNLTPVLHCKEQVELLELMHFSHPLPVIVKLNTGMNRLGFRSNQLTPILQRLERCDVGEIMLMTHFASADEQHGITKQVEQFNLMTKDISYPCSLANSAATLRCPEAHRDMVRLGIALYGASPFADESARNLGLQPAMTLTSEIISIQELSAGEQVGYGGTYVANQSMLVGVVACGYADGYPRHAGSGTPVCVNGLQTRILGRVSMDMLCVDLTNIPNACVGMPVELWGEQVSVDDVARSAGTISYELLSSLTKRVPVVYDSVDD